MLKAYPPREFPNVPSLQESVDLWRQACFDGTPKLLRSLIPTSFALGIVLLCIWTILVSGSFELTINGQHRESEALGFFFGAGVLCLALPLVFIARLSASMPAMPTAEEHEKLLKIMRLRHEIQEMDSKQMTEQLRKV